ncbi:hypothetical protein P4O66_010348, partial [Electrophorus voltai]
SIFLNHIWVSFVGLCKYFACDRFCLGDSAVLLQFLVPDVFGVLHLGCAMLCSAVLAALLLLLVPLVPSHARTLHSPDHAMQVIEQVLEHYNDLLTLDDLQNLTSDPSEEPVQPFNSGLKVAESPKWIDLPVQSENSWLRLLKGALASQKRALSDRSRRGWNRGCFGLKLDRIGSMSGLGC